VNHHGTLLTSSTMSLCMNTGLFGRGNVKRAMGYHPDRNRWKTYASICYDDLQFHASLAIYSQIFLSQTLFYVIVSKSKFEKSGG